MANNLSAFAPALLTLATTYLLHSTLLLSGAWLVFRTRRIRSEALKERLWKLAAVLPLCTAPLQLVLNVSPPTFELARGDRLIQPESRVVGVPPATETAPMILNPLPEATRAETHAPSQDGRLMAEQSELLEVPSQLSPKQAGSVAMGALSDASPPQTADPPTRPALNWFAAGLAGVCCVGIGRLVCQSLVFSLRLRDCAPVRDLSTWRMLEQIARRAGARRRFRLLASPTFRQPAAFGVFRWTIVLPEDVLRNFAPSELYALLAHESAHLVRGDAIWLWVGRILCSCLAIQPLNFVARREWRRSSELLCDQWAVHHAANGLALARCLTRVAELNSLAAPQLEALWALGTPSHLSQRVERLLEGACESDAWATRARRRLITIAALGIATAFVWAAPRTTVLANAREPFSGGSVEERPMERTNIRLLGNELRDLSAEINHVSHLVQSRLPANPNAIELAKRISARASELETRYEKLARATGPPNDAAAEATDEVH
jgi:beta-lactamase regulating signal transducer with metallopeptidase domain